LSHDIQGVLDGWAFVPDEIQARIITGDDGREKIQMRIDLGLVQMEITGRPDGERPDGFESLLESYEARAQTARESGESFALDAGDCARLMREGLQYYHRYLSAFHLGRYQVVARDTERNLRLFAFVRASAARERDKLEFDQYRPYVHMMLTRALASEAIEKGDYRSALEKIDEGVKNIRRFLGEYKQADRESECSELLFLLRWRREVDRERPKSAVERLEHQLDLSVERENYEEAARIRDQIRKLQDPDSH
jgi:UvrB/uvrC motif